jgi:hypothetical protein
MIPYQLALVDKHSRVHMIILERQETHIQYLQTTKKR